MSDQPEGKVVGLRPHRLIRIATIYVVAGWLSIPAADIVLEAFESPTWLMQTFLITVVAGLPLTLVGVWLVDRTRRSRSSSPLAFFLIIGVALVISSTAYLYFSADQPAAPSESRSVQKGHASNPVLAVLPFVNMSSVATNVHLADGLTEDVITLLAQSPGVEVIARNSTFKYRGQNPDIRDVGRDLGADYVIEGSVRPLSGRIRVTVQVIDAESGAHIWAEKYDRPMADFLEIEDDPYRRKILTNALRGRLAMRAPDSDYWRMEARRS